MSTAESLPYEQGVRELVATYRRAQRDIIRMVRAAVASQDLRTAQQRRLYLAAVTALLDQLGAHTDPVVRRLVFDAYHQGADRAGASITGPEIPGAFSGMSREAVTALEDQIAGRVQDARRIVGRTVNDVYARAGRRAALRALVGADGSPRAAQRSLMLDLQKDREVGRLLKDSRGLTGFVDRAGKRWALDTYAEMAVRTTTRQAVVQGAVDRMVSHGVTLARVSTHAGACPVCTPFEGRLVDLSGSVSEYQGEAVMDSSRIPPFHPNCAHSLAPVVTELDAFRAQRQTAKA